MKNTEIYEKITGRIIELMEQGVMPWRKSWNTGAGGGMAHNGTTKRQYTGANIYLNFLEYDSTEYYTWNQIQDAGAKVKKGAHCEYVTFWSTIKCVDQETKQPVIDERTGKQKEIPFLRYYAVYNRDFIEGLPPAPEAAHNDIQPIDAAEALLQEYKDIPEIRNGSSAYYMPGSDVITVPAKETFDNAEEYYSKLYHEAIHSTGSKKRLNRDQSGDFGTGSYSKEELVAEIGASYLCAIAGIENKTIDNSAAYIRGWISKLKDDPKMFFDAARLASKAVEYWRGTNGEYTPEEKQFSIAKTKKSTEIIKTPEGTAAKSAPIWEQMELF